MVQYTVWQKVKPLYSGHLSTTDNAIGPKDVRLMEVQPDEEKVEDESMF